jgi:putative two-component system response regulator
LATALKARVGHDDTLSIQPIDLVAKATCLYDVGMAALPDSIVLKASALTGPERTAMQGHCEIGMQAIARIEQPGGSGLTLLNHARVMAGSHHECWNGSGYPAGLSGTSIPLSARILAVVDVYDALTSPRPYRAAYTHRQALSMIETQRGVQLDPTIVDVALDLADSLLAIHSLPPGGLHSS